MHDYTVFWLNIFETHEKLYVSRHGWSCGTGQAEDRARLEKEAEDEARFSDTALTVASLVYYPLVNSHFESDISKPNG